MNTVRPKKALGQHFLTDRHTAEKIVGKFSFHKACYNVLEIGAGTGMLTNLLLSKKNLCLKVVEKDKESIHFLRKTLKISKEQLLHGDYLKLNLQELFKGSCAIVGNFPYNISSQIFFSIYEQRNYITEVVCVVQKEVAQRIVAAPGKKNNGILSILLQAFFEVNYEFSIAPCVFHPAPKVQSAVITLKRNEVQNLGCAEKLFKRVVKQGFGQRRKTLRNALKSLGFDAHILKRDLFSQRAEQLSVQDFIELGKLLEAST